jgi:hypothetical protein
MIQLQYYQLLSTLTELQQQHRWAMYAYTHSNNIGNAALMIWQRDRVKELEQRMLTIQWELQCRELSYMRVVEPAAILQHMGLQSSYNPAAIGGTHGGGNSATVINFGV